MDRIRRILFRLFGLQRYLYIISKLFFIAFRTGYLRDNRIYYCHYFVKNLINKGDTVIDIGANLGYYSVIFARLAGKEGKVYAVEPVSLFREVLEKNTNKHKNVEILPFALGKEDNTNVKMGMPNPSKYLAHGRTHIIDKALNGDECYHVSEAVMRNPAVLFKELITLDYIKCDIEGFEIEVIPEFTELITRFHPIVQIETDENSRNTIFGLMVSKGYKCFYVNSLKLVQISNASEHSYGDLIFIHLSSMEKVSAGLVPERQFAKS